MQFNQQSVLKAAGIGAVVNAIIGIIAGVTPLLGVDFVTALVGLLACCGGILIPVITGALYGYFTPGKETLSEAATGGAISGLVAGLVYSVFNGVVTAVVGLVQGQDFGAIVAGGATTTLIGICCGAIIFGTILGAIGGVVWTAVQGDK